MPALLHLSRYMPMLSLSAKRRKFASAATDKYTSGSSADFLHPFEIKE